MEVKDTGMPASGQYYSTRPRMDDYDDRILSYPFEKRQDKWSVSWSDLMMTMFIFFAVLYVYQTGNRTLKFGEGPGRNFLSESGARNVIDVGLDHTPSQVYDQTRQAVAEIMLRDPGAMSLAKDRAVRIVLAGDLLFDPGRADLKLGARYQLNQIARVINENNFAVNVVGHTDDMPTHSKEFPTNWELSSRRAVMVARYLTEINKVDPDRVFVSAYSYHQPVRPNDTARNRALNRRVEIILVKEKPGPGNFQG